MGIKEEKKVKNIKKFEARNHPMLMNEIKCWALKTNAKIISIDHDENSLNRVTARVVYEIKEPFSFWNKLSLIIHGKF